MKPTALVFAAILPCAALAAEPAAPPPPAAEVAQPAPSWSAMATVREEYRGRFSSGPSESDHTLRLFADVDARSPQEAVAIRGSLGFWWRAAQSWSTAEGSELTGLFSPRDPVWLDVYALSAEWRPGRVLESLIAGRQEAEHGTAATFDGLSLQLAPAHGFEVFAFGGRSVHFFEIEPGLFENWMASAGLGFRGAAWRIEADYRFLKEDAPALPADPAQGDKGEPLTKKELLDHSYGVAAWFRHEDWFNARLQVRGLNDAFHLVGAAVRVEWLAQQLGLDARLDVQPATLGEINEFDSPLFLTLGESKPHLKARVDLFKIFTSGAGDYGVHLGGDVRQLIDAEESPFNRNLLRGYLVLSAQKIAGTGLYLSASGEYHRVAAGEGLLTAGGALGWDRKPVRAEVGTSYHRWQYVYYQAPEEIADVREVYADVKVNVVKWLALRARYSFQVFDRELHTVTFAISEAL